MAEQDSTTKVEEEIKDRAPDVDAEDLMSLESLDSALAEEDPEFAQSLMEIGPDEIAVVELYDESLQLEYTLAEEEKIWQAATGMRKKMFRVLPFLPKLSYKLKLKRLMLRLTWVKFKERTRYRLKNAVPLTLEWLKAKVAELRQVLGGAIASFKAFSLLRKLGLVALILTTGVAGYLLYSMGTKGLVPRDNELFIRSMSDWATQKYQFDPKREVEPFYDSTRAAQNVFLLQKMVVNLRRSAESSTNPMGAFEFYVEGAASDVVVEIKDREAEVEDLFLRTLEEMTFEQASSGEGKQILCDRLRKEINKILTKGYVRRVFIKTAIIKP